MSYKQMLIVHFFSKAIPISIVNTDSYNRSVGFTIELGVPVWPNKPEGKRM